MTPRNLPLALLAAVVAVGTFTSCGKRPESRGPASAGKADKIELRLHLEAGKSYPLRMTSDQKISQTQGESKQEIPQTTGFGLSHLVKEVRDDGTAVVQVTYDAVQLKQAGLMGNVDYDSSNPAPAESLHPMVKGLAALVGQSFVVDLTPKGEVTRVEGADQLVARMTANVEVPMPAMRTLIEQQMQQQFGDQAMKEMMEQMVGIYPDKPVGIGDSWSKRSVVTRGFAAIINNTWTLKSRSEGVAVVDLQSTVEPNPDAPPLEMGTTKIQYALRGTQNGSIELAEATGWVLRSTVNQDLSGELTIQSGPDAAKAMTVPISIQGVTRVVSP